MKWSVAADFFTGQDDVWLDDFIDDPRISFRKVPPPQRQGDWHVGRSARTTARGWGAHMRHALSALRARPEGVITTFPQLAMCAGLLKRLGIARPRILAYHFNLGALPGGARRRLARAAAPAIDAFVVHAPSEIRAYADYLGLPTERFRFVPVQKGEIGIDRDEDRETPYLLAMGSAHRDWATLIEAVEPIALPTVIVTRADLAETLPKRPWLSVKSGLSAEDCMRFLARARLSVTPISNMETASGQVTFVNAMRMGVAVIATECPGTEGYIENGRTGRLVPPGDAVSLRREIADLWADHAGRAALEAAGKAEAEARFSDPAVAEMLRRILLEFEENA